MRHPHLALALCLLALTPGLARAYTVLGDAQLERVDVLVAFDGEEEVLSIVPRWRGAGRLLLPVPGDATLVPGTDTFRPRGPQAPDELGPRSLTPDAPRKARAERPDMKLPNLTQTYRVDAGEAILHLGAEAVTAALGEDAASLPAEVLAAYREKGYGLLELDLPAVTETSERAPVAVRFSSDRALLPIRLYRAGPHVLAIAAVVPVGTLDLGGMDTALGLRRDGGDQALPETLASTVAGWFPEGAKMRLHRLVAPGLARDRVGRLTVDLGLFPEPPAPEAPASAKNPPEKATGSSGCGCSATQGDPAAPLLALALCVLGIRRRL